jgi:glyoxylase-like metal-dependent hydrolase (beta-lactamase superfamily II)
VEILMSDETGRAPLRDSGLFTPGAPVALTAGLQRVVVPNAGPMTGPGTNTYLLGEREVWVIDPGPALPVHGEALLAAIAGRPVGGIVVTHTHGDHSPLAAWLHEQTGAPRIGRFARHAGYQDSTFVPEIVPEDGYVLETDVGELQLLATPGHASNHLCGWWPASGVLFTGDHVLQGVTPVILPPDGDMGEYLASLARLQTLPLLAIAPGHGGLITDPQANLAALVAHRLKREAKVLAALGTVAAQGAVPVEDLLPVAYDDVPVAMHGWARYSLLAHLLKLVNEERALCLGTAPKGGAPDHRRFGLPAP